MNKKILSEKLQDLFTAFENYKESHERHSNAISLHTEIKNIETEFEIFNRKKQKVKDNRFFKEDLKEQYLKNLEKNIQILQEQYTILKDLFSGFPPIEDHTEKKIIEIVDFLQESNSGRLISHVSFEKNKFTERFETLILPFIKDKSNGIKMFVQQEDNNKLSMYFESNIDNFFKLNDFMSVHNLQNDFSRHGIRHISFDSHFYVPFEEHNLTTVKNPVAIIKDKDNFFKQFSNNNIFSIPFQYNFNKDYLIEGLYLKLEEHFNNFNNNNVKNIFRDSKTYLENGIFEDTKKLYSHKRPKI